MIDLYDPKPKSHAEHEYNPCPSEILPLLGSLPTQFFDHGHISITSHILLQILRLEKEHNREKFRV